MNSSPEDIAMNRYHISSGVTLLAGLLALPTSASLAQWAAVAGRVTDSASHHPLVSAQVYVGGTTLRTLTDPSGRFRFDHVPPGAVTLRVVMIGYKQVARAVTVAAGEAPTIDFALQSVPVGLDAVIVTATGEQTQREQPNAIHKLDPADITSKAPILDMSNLLSGRAPGLLVQDAGGTTGSGTRTRIRGSNSLSLSNEPVIYVDGIRVENGASSISVGVGGQTPSRLNDINPNDLETVQVAGGPSSSVLYGTDAANGVIQIQTKQGKPGPTQWDVYAEGGVLNDITTYPANYRGADSRDSTCTLINQLAGACVHLPETDNTALGVLSSGFLGRADRVNQGYGFLTPQQSFSILTFQTIDRFTGSFQGNSRPAEWLVVRGVAGIDFTSRFDEKTFLTGAIPAAFSGALNAEIGRAAGRGRGEMSGG